MSDWKRTHTHVWVWGGAILLIATGVASVFWHEGRWHRPSGRGRVPLPWTTAALETNDLPALKSRAKQAVAEGRFAEAFTLYRHVDGLSWSADDCFTLGSALMRRDRVVLAWASLEAARRIDPKHSATLGALETIQGKLAAATGQERDKFHEAARRVETLRVIPAGPPLGLLALGLARFAATADQEDEFLERLATRDRAALRRVDSSAAATALVARLLLERGSARQAYELLDSMMVHAVSHNERASRAQRPMAKPHGS